MQEKTTISPEEIRSFYFGQLPNKLREKESSSSRSSAELTPSAKYVVSETKKRIGKKLAVSDNSQLDEELIVGLVKQVEEIEGEELSERERTAVVAALSASLDHYDILTPLVENPEVNDIIISSYDDISIQIGRKNIQTDLKFANRDTYTSFVENLLKRAGKACTLATPVVDAAVDPNIRACVTHESFSPPGAGPMLTLRIARHSDICLEGLVRYELAPRPIMEYLGALISSGNATILIAGEVGTGKTTLVKALASRIDHDEATLIIEDTHEIALRRPFVRTLLTREANTEGAGRISPAKAIRTGMRMAMNRIILGEMRDGEAAEAFVDVCASGHSGMSTIHARSARDALARLELFLLRAEQHVSIETVRRQIANAISVVVYLGLDKGNQKRRIMNVVEVGSASDGAVQISPIYSYEPHALCPEWHREAGISYFAAELSACGVSLPPPGSYIGFEPEQLYRTVVE